MFYQINLVRLRRRLRSALQCSRESTAQNRMLNTQVAALGAQLRESGELVFRLRNAEQQVLDGRAEALEQLERATRAEGALRDENQLLRRERGTLDEVCTPPRVLLPL